MSERNVPFGLLKWIADSAADFEPPVANKVIWKDSHFIFMVVSGPNARSDVHIDPRDEIFYQLKGDVRVDNIETELKDAINTFNSDDSLRTCNRFGHQNVVPGPFQFENPNGAE